KPSSISVQPAYSHYSTDAPPSPPPLLPTYLHSEVEFVGDKPDFNEVLLSTSQADLLSFLTEHTISGNGYFEIYTILLFIPSSTSSSCTTSTRPTKEEEI